MNKIKQFSEQQKLNMLKFLREGKIQTVDKDALDNQVTVQVSTNLEDNVKIQDKDAFEEFKTLYKDTIDDRCMQDYGTIEDKKLWDDCAKEMYLQSEQYILKGDEFKPTETLNEDFGKYKILTKGQYLNLAKKYGDKINDYDVKMDKGKFFISIPDYNTLIDEEEIDNKNESKLTEERYQLRKFTNEYGEFKGQWGAFDTKEDKFVQKGSKKVMQAAVTDLNNQSLKKESANLTDEQVDQLYDKMRKFAQEQLNIKDQNELDTFMDQNMPMWKEMEYNLHRKFEESNNTIVDNTLTSTISSKVKEALEDECLNNKKTEDYDISYHLEEYDKVLRGDNDTYCVKIENRTAQTETKWLLVDKQYVESMKNIENNYKVETESKLQEDQYEAERRRGVPSVKRVAEQEVYDNEEWYKNHINDYKDITDFVNKNITEIASEYNLRDTKAEEACKEIYKLAISLVTNKIEETKDIIKEQDSFKKQANLTDGIKKQIAQQYINDNKEQLEQCKGLNDIINNNIETICKTYNVLQPVAKDICAYIYNLLK